VAGAWIHYTPCSVKALFPAGAIADLAALESVDEEVVLYAAPGADLRLLTASNASARAEAGAGLVNRIREVRGHMQPCCSQAPQKGSWSGCCCSLLVQQANCFHARLQLLLLYQIVHATQRCVRRC
jgi:hypothetical protein